MTAWLLEWHRKADAAPCLISPRGGHSGSVSTRRDGSFAALTGNLLSPSPSHAGASAADLLFDTYRRHGETSPDVLRGSFLAVLWDAPRQRLLAFRDAIGLGPGYYSCQDHCLRLSADIDQLRGRGENHGVDRVLIAELLRLRFHQLQTEQTFFEGIHRLPPARLMTVTPHSMTLETYWEPLAEGFRWNSDEERARFPALLESSVTACMAAGADGLALSGGFDSVALATVASQQTQQTRKRPLHALSLQMPPPCDESATQRAVSEALGLPLTLIPSSQSQPRHDVVKGALALSSTSPGPVLSLWQALYSSLLDAAHRSGCHRVMFGTGGDDLLNVDTSYGADCLATLRLPSLWRFWRAALRTSPLGSRQTTKTFLWSGALRPLAIEVMTRLSHLSAPTRRGWHRLGSRLRAGRQPWLISDDGDLLASLEDRWQQARDSTNSQWGGSYLATLRGLIHHPLAMLEHEQGAAWNQRTGTMQLLPFYDRDLVTHLLRTHPRDLIADGIFKSPLRRMVEARLPSVPLPTKKVDFSQAVHQALRPTCWRAWQEAGGGSELAALGISNPHEANSLVHSYHCGYHDKWLPTWLLLTCESWLRAQRPSCSTATKGASSEEASIPT